MECEEEFNSKDIEVTVLSIELVVRDNDVEMSPILAPAPHESNNIMGSTSQTIAASTDEGELLRWHYRLGHLPWAKLKLLALLNIIPRKLATIRHPPCPCCIAASMTRIPTRTKGSRARRTIKESTTTTWPWSQIN